MDNIIAVLRSLEWSERHSHHTDWPCCPECWGIKHGYDIDENGNPSDNSGHAKDCRLNRAIND